MFSNWNDKHKGFAVFTAMLLLFGLAMKESLFFALAGGTFAILVVSRWWYHNALKKVDVEMQFVTKRIFPSDQTKLRIEISNRKMYSVPFVFVHFKTRKTLHIDGMKEKEYDSKYTGYSHMCSLKPKQTLVFEFDVTADQRGLYRIEDAMLESGDPFGLSKIVRYCTIESELIVYPTILTPIPFYTNLNAEQGKFTVRRFMLDDPTFHLGSRPYVPGDPMKRIDWNVTARTRTLHTKQYDYTTEKHVVIVANVHTSEVNWMSQNEDAKERVISLVATIVKWCTEKGYTYEWMMNIKLPRARQLLHEQGGTNKRDLMLQLEKLGRLKSFITVNIENAFSKIRELNSNGNILMAITSYRNSKMEAEWDKWIHHGGQVWIVNPENEEVTVERYTGNRRSGGRTRVS